MPTPIRTIQIINDIALIPLTKGYVATIDAADAWLVERWNWFALETKTSVYAGRGTGLHGRKYTVLLHRHLVSAPQGFDVDHRDGQGLNCRRENLRLATPAQNGHNRGVASNNALGVKGVFHNGSSFVAMIGHQGENKYLGSFPTVEQAQTAYADAARVLYGAFARAQ